jgi:hypothetical protein
MGKGRSLHVQRKGKFYENLRDSNIPISGEHEIVRNVLALQEPIGIENWMNIQPHSTDLQRSQSHTQLSIELSKQLFHFIPFPLLKRLCAL